MTHNMIPTDEYSARWVDESDEEFNDTEKPHTPHTPDTPDTPDTPEELEVLSVDSPVSVILGPALTPVSEEEGISPAERLAQRQLASYKEARSTYYHKVPRDHGVNASERQSVDVARELAENSTEDNGMQEEPAVIPPSFVIPSLSVGHPGPQLPNMSPEMLNNVMKSLILCPDLVPTQNPQRSGSLTPSKVRVWAPKKLV